MDIMGGVRLSDGRELKIVTGIDDHSRLASLEGRKLFRSGSDLTSSCQLGRRQMA